MIFHIDFETFSEINLKTHGMRVYAESAEVLCMAWAFKNKPVELWLPGEPIPSLLKNYLVVARIWAHNAAFERAIWKWVMVPKHGFPPVHDDQWVDTMALAAYSSLPQDLDGCAKALQLSELKDAAGHSAMLTLCKPRNPTKHNPDTRWTPKTAPDKFSELYKYCRQDVKVERLLAQKLPKALPPKELELWRLNLKINDRGIPIDRDALKAALDIEQKTSNRYNKRLQLITEDALKTSGQVTSTLNWLADKHQLFLPDLQANTIQRTLKENNLPETAREVLEIRLINSLASTKKLKAMLRRSHWCEVTKSWRVANAHRYHGAATGRWSGDGIQPHNFPRGTMGPADLDLVFQLLPQRDPAALETIFEQPASHIIRSAMRSFIAAPKGKSLLVCDFAGIEARVLAWLANETDLLEAFRNREDVYKKMASDIYSRPVPKITKSERQLGKVAILGLGYGMGAGRFEQTANSYGIDIEPTMAKHIVDLYRKTYPKIRSLWYETNRAAIDCIETGKGYDLSYVSLRRGTDWFWIYLPSGRALHYYKPHIVMEPPRWGGNPVKQIRYASRNIMGRWCNNVHTYGGKLVENIVQAIARDLLAEALLRLDKRGWSIVMHVHDEIVCEEHDGQFCTPQKLESDMCIPPSWATGCPVAAEAFSTRRYRK